MATATLIGGTKESFAHDAVAYVIPCPELAESYDRNRGASHDETKEQHNEGGDEATTPTTFVAALKDKYCYTDHAASTDSPVTTFITDFVIIRSPRRRRGNSSSASLSGGSTEDAEDEAVLGHLMSVSLAGLPLVGPGEIPPSGLVGLCPNVSELDLTNTGLTQWNIILEIFAALPKLTRANLSRNRLANTEGVSLPPLPLPRLEFLDVTDTRLDWSDLQNLGQWFPHIKQLQVCCNGLSTICSESIAFFPRLETLLLNDNEISDWNEVWKLSSLQKLEYLVLSGNPLTSIGYTELSAALPDFVPPCPVPPTSPSDAASSAASPRPSSSGAARSLKFDYAAEAAASDPAQPPTQRRQRPPFPALTSLTLTDTHVGCWTDLAALSRFPKLDNLRLKGIPLLDKISIENPEEKRGFLIACLPKAKTVNGSPVTDEERTKCERAFVRHFSTFSSSQLPLRYHELVDVHGELEPLPDVDLGLRTHQRLAVYAKGAWIFSVDVRLADPAVKLFEVIAKKLKCKRHVLRIYHSSKAPSGEEAIDEIVQGHLTLSRFDFKEGDSLLLDGDFDLPEMVKEAIEASR